MLKALKVDDVITTKAGDAKIRRIGPAHYGETSKHSWSMLTLDINGQVAYCVAREDELAESK